MDTNAKGGKRSDGSSFVSDGARKLKSAVTRVPYRNVVDRANLFGGTLCSFLCIPLAAGLLSHELWLDRQTERQAIDR